MDSLLREVSKAVNSKSFHSLNLILIYWLHRSLNENGVYSLSVVGNTIYRSSLFISTTHSILVCLKEKKSYFVLNMTYQDSLINPLH